MNTRNSLRRKRALTTSEGEVYTYLDKETLFLQFMPQCHSMFGSQIVTQMVKEKEDEFEIWNLFIHLLFYFGGKKTILVPNVYPKIQFSP